MTINRQLELPTFFLDGLGSNRYYSQDLLSALEQGGLPVTYLPLPGHPGYSGPRVTDETSFLEWLDEALPAGLVRLMGFSLGADLAAAYALRRPDRVQQLVLLDGGVLDLSAIGLEEELAGADAYMSGQQVVDMAQHLAEQAAGYPSWTQNLAAAEELAYVYDQEVGCYRLNLDRAQVLDLLRLRAQFGPSLQSPSYKLPTLAVLSDQPAELLAQKQAYLAKLPHDWVQQELLSDSDHGFCQAEVARLSALLLSALPALAC